MASRLEIISNRLSSKITPYVEDSITYLGFTDLLTKQEHEHWKACREFCQKEIAPFISQDVENARFPEYLFPKVQKFRRFGEFLQPPYGKGISTMANCLGLLEISRADSGLGVACLVHWCLATYTIEQFGNQDQKQRYLPRLHSMEIISGWALTEALGGSDASGMITTATQVQGGYMLNGEKRWMGMANRNLCVVWAKNAQTKKVEAYIVDDVLKTKGLTITVIKNKGACRIINNCNLTFSNVFVPEQNKLPGAKDFNDVNSILRKSRLLSICGAAGTAIGCYDVTIRYMMNRKQFGTPIGAFQLQQEQIVRVMGIIQSFLIIIWRLVQLDKTNEMSIGQASMAKAFFSEKVREVTKVCREIWGGNGIIFDNFVMRAMMDMEVFLTGEGTYDICVLVAGRQLTGLSALKNTKN